MKNTQGITLITLVITVIILLILAGIAIATLTDENGILTKTNTSKEMTQEAEAKEILELSLISAVTQKFTTNEYNPNEWLNEYVIAENPNELITINEDIFIVNGWGFLVDRNVPKIVENLGKTSGIPKIASIKILSGDKQESGWYTSNIKIRIQGSGYKLYKNGNEYTEVTGGWQKIYKIQHKATKRAKSSAVNLVKEDEYLGFHINGEGIATSTAVGYQCGATVGISNRLKIENYKYMNTKIAVGLYSYNSDATCGMVMDGDGITYLAPTETEVDYGLIAYSNGTDTPKNFRWDISHFKGQYSPAIYLQSRENKLSWADIYEVYLIK